MKLSLSYESYLHPGNSLKTIVSVRVSTCFVTGLASSVESPSDVCCWNNSISAAGICGDDNLVMEGSA